MDQNNSSTTENEQNVWSIEVDEQEKVDDDEYNKLKYENFQLRLRCYNYEKFINNYHNSGDNENDKSLFLQKELYDKTVELSNLEGQIYQLKQENSSLRLYLDRSNSKKKLIVNDVDIQCELNLEENELMIEENKIVVEKLLEHISILEQENNKLKTSVMEMEESLKKPPFVSSSINTEFTLPSHFLKIEPDMFDPPDPSNDLNLVTSVEKSIKTIDIYLNEVTKNEYTINEIESAIISTMKLKYDENDEGFRVDLYKDEWLRSIGDRSKLVELMVQCNRKVIEDDLQIGMFDINIGTRKLKKKEPNPNTLAIDSLIKRLDETREDITVLRKKIKLNEKCNKLLSKSSFTRKEITSMNLIEDLDLFNERINELSSNLIKMIPLIKSTFGRTTNYFETMRSAPKPISDFRTFIQYQYEQNERAFLDYSNSFIQASCDCVNILNKQKLFINNATNLFNCWLEKRMDEFIEVEQPIIQSYKQDDSKEDFAVVCMDSSTQTIELENVIKSVCPKCKLRPTDSICATRSETASNMSKDLDDIVNNKSILQTTGCGDVGSDVFGNEDNLEESNYDVTMMTKFICSLQSSSHIRKCHSMICLNTDYKVNNSDNSDTVSVSSIYSNNSNVTYQSYTNDTQRNIVKERFKSLKNNQNFNKSSSYNYDNHEVKHHSETNRPSPSLDSRGINVNFGQSLCDSTKFPEFIDDTSTSDLVIHLKSRLMRILLIHDLRKYIQIITRYDKLITQQFTTLTETVMTINSSDSSLFLDSRQALEEWRTNIAKFQRFINENTTIPPILLALPDQELIQLSFMKGNCKLDFPFNYQSIETLIDEVSIRFDHLNILYQNMSIKRQEILKTFNELHDSSKQNITQALHKHIQRLEQENDRYKAQLNAITDENNQLIETETNYQHQIDMLKQKLNDYIKNENQMKNILDNYIKDYTNNKELYRELEENYSKELTKNNELSKENEKLKIKLDDSIKITDELNLLKQHEIQLLKSQQEYKETIDKMTMENNKMKEEIEENQVKCSNLESDCKQLKKILHDNKMHDLNDEIWSEKLRKSEKRLQEKQMEKENAIIITSSICKKVNKLIFKLMDFLLFVDQNFSQSLYDQRFNVSTDWLNKDTELIKRLKAANVYIGVILDIIVSKNREYKLFGMEPKLKQLSSSLSAEDILKLLSTNNLESILPNAAQYDKYDNKINQITKNCFVSHKNLKKKLLDLSISKTVDSGLTMNSKANKSSKLQRNMSNDVTSISEFDEPSMDNLELETVEEEEEDDDDDENEDTYCTEDKCIPRNTVNVMDNGDDDNHINIEQIQNLKNIAVILNTDVNYDEIDSDENNSETNEITVDPKLKESTDNCTDWKQLIETNHNLTQNLIDTNKKLMYYQQKLELQTNELRHVQAARQDTLVELKSKYEKVVKLEQEIDQFKKSQSTFNKNKITKRNISIQTKFKDQTAISKVPPINTSTTPIITVNEAKSPNSTNSDWDDVTRTMIKCLTTLSEVQESLESPVTSNKEEIVRPTSNAPISSNCKSSEKEETIPVVLLKERRFSLIRKFLVKLQLIINKINIKNLEEQEELLKQSSELLNKLMLLFDSNSKSALLNQSVWSNLSKSTLLDIPNTIYSDSIIEQLRHKLVRYQTRYRGLKNAVLSNKIQLKQHFDANCTDSH